MASLIIPEELEKELREVAERHGITLLDLLKKFIKLGLIAVSYEEKGDGMLIAEDSDGRQKQIIVFSEVKTN